MPAMPPEFLCERVSGLSSKQCLHSVVTAPHSRKQKKADVAEHPEVFDHVGLLTNEPPGTAGLLIS